MFVPGRVAIAVVITGAIFGGRALYRVSAQAATVQPRCQNIQLHVTPGRSNGAAGHDAVLYRLHNMWGSACTLAGYPGVQLLDRSFQDLPTNLHRGGLVLDGRRTPTTVSVAGHGNAWFALEYQDIPNGTSGCPTASFLLVTPPNDYLPVVTYATSGGYGHTACAGDLHESPVTAGNAGF